MSIVDKENIMLFNGNVKISAHFTHEHLKHIQEHTDYLRSLPDQLATTEIMVRFIDHIKEHEKYLQACVCGGSYINPQIHTKECPESKTTEYLNKTEDTEHRFYGDYEEYMGRVDNEKLKCECGAESVGCSGHSEWCANHKKG